MPVIQIRKLAAVDMLWLGKRVVLIEYALGVVLPLALGVLSVQKGLSQHDPTGFQMIMGVWLVAIAANYVPLLLHAVAIARSGAVEPEGRPELARAGRYGVQQVMILVPLLVVGLALSQERERRRSTPGS